MEVGKHLVRIKDYGLSQSKTGGLTIFIDVEKDGDSKRWYGSPYKRDGEVNEMCIAQLAACGFDPSAGFDKLGEGVEGGALITDEDIDCVVANELNGKGELEPRLKWIGINPTPRLSADEAKQIVTSEQQQKLMASASKFKPRARKKKQDPDEPVPF
jgi:hypothetical protein